MDRGSPNSDVTMEHLLPFQQDEAYWSFQGRSTREFSHAYLQYPAMMVPQMQGEIIDHICRNHRDTRRVWDPFVGSGTSLGECMLRGLDFVGNDINPLAVLVSKTKGGPLNVKATRKKAEALVHRIDTDDSDTIDVSFPGLEKWFSTHATIQLARIRRCICSEESLWARRFFWVVFAETIRLTSNSRTSTYKLHIRPDLEKAQKRKDPITVFRTALANNVAHLDAFKNQLTDNGHLRRGRYVGKLDIHLANTTLLHPNFLRNEVDLIITSPPYGDNQTTIPYGQYSYLPLSWIPLEDIDPKATLDFLESTCAIDAMSLGGSKREAATKAETLRQKSITFSKLYDALGEKSHDAQKKVASFFYDLDCCIDPLLKRLRKGGNMVWTLGNRTVSNTTVPMDRILIETFESRNVRLSNEFERTIPTKRMAGRNNISHTMSKETILIMQKTTD